VARDVLHPARDIERRMEGPMADIRSDDHWPRHGVALLELSASVLSTTPAPSRRAARTFAEVARGLAERAPAWLRPWPVLTLDAVDDERPLVAVSLTRDGPGLAVREAPPAPGTLTLTVVLEYYLHHVHDNLRACRLAARRPGGGLALTPGDAANLAEAFEEIDRVLHGAAGRERLDAVWAQLPVAV
jgi:hypothetical protein